VAEVSGEFLATVRYVADLLKNRVPATPVEGEEIALPVEDENGRPGMWTGQTTTYTLGLMLSGALQEVDRATENSP
jgi:hypothetical protein